MQPTREAQQTKVTQELDSDVLDAFEKVEMPISSSTSPTKAALESELISKMVAAYKQLLHNRIVTYCSNALETMLISGEPLAKVMRAKFKPKI